MLDGKGAEVEDVVVFFTIVVCVTPLVQFIEFHKKIDKVNVRKGEKEHVLINPNGKGKGRRERDTLLRGIKLY